MLLLENNQSRAMMLLFLGLSMICSSVKPCTYLSHLLKLTKGEGSNALVLDYGSIFVFCMSEIYP